MNVRERVTPTCHASVHVWKILEGDTDGFLLGDARTQLPLGYPWGTPGTPGTWTYLDV